jgi:hypothetical protein
MNTNDIVLGIDFASVSAFTRGRGETALHENSSLRNMKLGLEHRIDHTLGMGPHAVSVADMGN